MEALIFWDVSFRIELKVLWFEMNVLYFKLKIMIFEMKVWKKKRGPTPSAQVQQEVIGAPCVRVAFVEHMH